jgi:hypothetical protein
VRTEELTPEEVDAGRDGFPEWVDKCGFRSRLAILALRDVVVNALTQRSSASTEDLVKAAYYYWAHDAFIDFNRQT